MVIPDPARQGTAVERTINHHIDALPDGIAGEVRQWVKVVRGQGRRAHQELPFSSVRSYLNCFCPVLAEWSQHVTSLREITSDDVQEALGQHPGVTAHNLLPALRSLFRALKQERIIFRDPTSGITMRTMRRLPAPIPTDQLRGLIDRAGTPIAKVAVALIAIHGLGKKETTLLLLEDLDLPRGQLAVRRPTGTHTVYLDELTRTLMTGWLRERHRRWPLTAQPPPAGHQPDRRRHRRPAGRPYRHRRHLRRARPHPVQSPAGPDPGRGQAHRRPRPPHARLRPHRHTRHEVRPGSPPRTRSRHAAITPGRLMTAPSLPAELRAGAAGLLRPRSRRRPDHRPRHLAHPRRLHLLHRSTAPGRRPSTGKPQSPPGNRRVSPAQEGNAECSG